MPLPLFFLKNPTQYNMAIHRVKRTPEQIAERKKKVSPDSPVSDEAMAQLAKIMNDSPSLLRLHGTEWEIRGLKPAVQWLIAEQACKVVDGENKSMGDVIKEFATNMPAVAHVLTLALLNSKERIFSDYEKKVYSDEYHKVFDTLMWGDYDLKDWALLLGEVLNLINTDFFFQTISVLKTVREMTLKRKITKAEAE